jgi:hypothetical protein
MENIFKEIVHIMNNDYAGWKDKKGCDRPEYYIRKIKDNPSLTNAEFEDIVDDYLLDFNDRHIYFVAKNEGSEKAKSRGFQVRRFENGLYVTEVDSEKQVEPGMRFVSLGGHSIPELKEMHHRLLNENHVERENWLPILSQYEEGEIEDGKGNRKIIKFDLYDKVPYVPEYSVKKVDEKIIVITMTDFADPDAIVKMVADNKTLLDSTDKWIIDVRVNNGGSDSSYYPLFEYLLPEEGVELADEEDYMLFNCTEDNADRVIADIDEDLEETVDERARVFLNVFSREWKKNRGKGFVQFNFEEIVPDTFVKGSKHPASIIVLTDNRCVSSGDSFVELAKKSNKITVVGRATLGVNDYANLASKKWTEGFELWYPTSRLSRIDKGEGMTGVGIKPELYIPWTPEHIFVDKDLEKAIELLETKVGSK